jgi:hypothetical protein
MFYLYKYFKKLPIIIFSSLYLFDEFLQSYLTILKLQIPFGEVDTVKSYLCLAEYGYLIEKPLVEHPSRKIAGLNCHRKELSGLK